MELEWSEQSPTIRTLYRPWHPDAGYTEDAIQATEAHLGLRLPAVLRNFYLASRPTPRYGGAGLLAVGTGTTVAAG